MNNSLIEKINRLKKESGAAIFAHTYQPPEIIEIADLSGDSFALAQAARSFDAKKIIMCGVRFMAESIKILSPEKTVILASPNASCPMASQISPERVRRFKAENPGVPVVVYINTTAELKAECDICVTSSSALKIVSSLSEKELLFIPDKNLGAWIAKQVPDKKVILWDGYCPVHASLTAEEVENAKKAHPGAKLALHPECPPEVLALADMIGSTKEIIDFALAEKGGVIIGTERGVADTLTLKHPEKELYYLSPEKLVCPNMKMTGLADVVLCLEGQGGEIMQINEETRLRAAKCIYEMLKF